LAAALPAAACGLLRVKPLCLERPIDSEGVSCDAEVCQAAQWVPYRLHRKRSGPGSVIFAMAMPLNGYQWRGALDRLSEHRRCLAPDFLASAIPKHLKARNQRPEAQVAMLAAFLDAWARKE